MCEVFMYRIGYGEDIHRLEKNHKLILGGVLIPFDKGLVAHSDGDVLLHAIGESILGALALGDLGKFFPNTDDKYKNIDSGYLLKEIKKFMVARGYQIVNIDSSLFLEEPKMSPYIDEMRNSIASILSVEISQISVKACTNEGLDEVGKKNAIRAVAITLLEKTRK